MQILIPIFTITGKASYPDDYKLFNGMEQVEFNGSDYFVTDYSGVLDLETGADTYADYAPTVEIKTVLITGITGDLQHAPDFSKAACYQLTDVTVSGTVDIPDQFFAMPVKMLGSNEIAFFGAQVTGGAFDVVINFERSGQYSYTDAEANLDLPEQLYTVAPIKFDVLRKTTT